MSTSTISDWQELAVLRPRLAAHIKTYTQEYRGQRWYILHDESSGRYLRFNKIAYEFIGRMDGDHTLEEIWQQLQKKLGENQFSQDDISLIVTQLLNIDALRSSIHKRSSEVFKRFQQEQRQKRERAVMNPLSIRAPLFDPDALLNRFMPWVRPLFSKAGAMIWLVVVGYACLLALSNFSALFAAVNRDILAPDNLFWMALVFILIKIVHEFAHAFAAKMWGGEVHEMGITLLVLMPVPYVDASAATGFRDKRKRMFVSAAGIIAELWIAAIALLVWLAVEPGMVKDLALNALLIASVSTLLFNANPLLRFDGFYVLQDFIEIPNLYTRSSRYYLYLIQHYLFGLDSVRSPVTAEGERGWFIVYGLAAFIYRLIILVTIVLFLAGEYLFIGVALGTWAVIMQVLLPLWRAMSFLYQSPLLEGSRSRAKAITAGLSAAICLLLLLVPAPVSIHAEGVLWVSDQAEIYIETDGFIADLLVAPGTPVDAGEAVVKLTNPSLLKKINVLRSRCEELEIRSASERREQRVKSQIIDEELISIKVELALLEKQAGHLIIYSRVAGVFVKPDNQPLVGRYLRQGELLGYIVSPEHLIIRAVIPQSTIGLVLNSSSQVEVKFAERLEQTVLANMPEQVPAGSTRLPSPALGIIGGGSIAVVRGDEAGLTVAEKIFQVDLELPENLQPFAGLGGRAFVRFQHQSQPLAHQWWRSGRQLLLSHLDV